MTSAFLLPAAATVTDTATVAAAAAAAVAVGNNYLSIPVQFIPEQSSYGK